MILEDWGTSIEMKSCQLGSNGEFWQEAFLNEMVGVWTVQAMGMSKTTGFCVSDVHEVVTRRDSHHMQLTVPSQARVGETFDVTLFYWNSWFTQVTAQLQVYNGLCSKVRPGEWSTPKQFNATSRHQVAVSWPVVPLAARPLTVRVWVEAVDPDTNSRFKATSTFILQKSFVAKTAGVQRKFEQTFQLGTPLTPKPSGRQENPCFTVLPDATTQYNKQSKKQSMTLRAKAPPDALYESGKIEINIIGEPLGHILLDLPSIALSKLIEHHPIACGEQAMMRIGPLVDATLYLKQINQAHHETESVNIVSKGIMGMNKFRMATGAYCTWPGKAPSTWLTAYVAKVFSHAFLVTEMKGTLAPIICKSAEYVASRQEPSGRFSDPLDILMDESIAGGVDSTTSMTAYITVALLEVQRNLPSASCQKLSGVIAKAVDFLASHADQTNDTYTLSMMAYGLLLSGTQSAKGEQIVEGLLSTAKDNQDEEWKHWIIPRRTLTHRQRVRLIRNPVLSMEIETAAYTLLALVQGGRLSEAGGVAMWLTSQHRSNGRFISTQDTVIALQALTVYRSKVHSADLLQHVKLQQIQPLSAQVRDLQLVNGDRNLRHSYSYDLRSTHNDVLLELEGTGEVRVEAVCTYNTLRHSNTCPFNLTTTVWGRDEVSAGRPCYNFMRGDKSSCIENCYRYANSAGTNMAILYVTLHHLHRPNMENLDQIVHQDSNVDHVETNDRAVVFYLTQIPSEEHCIEFVVTPSAPLPLNTMPVTVHLYDYHDSERLQCERFYQPNVKLYTNRDKPIEYNYIKASNEFVCGEAPEPAVHDYMKGKAPVNSSDIEELLCNTKSPANVYALNVTFRLNNYDEFMGEYDASTKQTTYFLDADVNKILKSGSLPSELPEGVRFYVQRSWFDLQRWMGDLKNHPHIVIAADYQQHDGRPLLHLNKGDVYIQRLAPHKPWVTKDTRMAWKKLPQAIRNVARKNMRFLRAFGSCKV